MPSRRSYKSIMMFIIKIAILVSVYYYFSEQIHAYANAPDLGMAAAYSGGYAGIVMLLLLMFRWSGFLARVLAGLIGIVALSAVIVLYLINSPTMNGAFIGSYAGIQAVAILFGYAILFKKI